MTIEQQRSEASFAQHAGWAEKEEDCACYGTGWALSNLDQWHRCPFHGAGKRHPEDDEDPDLVPVERRRREISRRAERGAEAGGCR